MKALSAACLASALVLAGCGPATNRSGGPVCDGGVPQSSGGVTGYVECTPIAVMDSASWSLTQGSSDHDGGMLGDEILLLNSAGACSDLTMNSFPMNYEYAELGLTEQDPATGSEIQPTIGTFPITYSGYGKHGSATFAQYNQFCMPEIGSNDMTVGGQATSGTITVTSINLASGGGIAGSFQLSFGSDSLSGTFNSPFCGATISTAQAACR